MQSCHRHRFLFPAFLRQFQGFIAQKYSYSKDAWKSVFLTPSSPAIKSIVASFQAPILYAFAYGSAVFKQYEKFGSEKDNKLLDFIFVVNCTQEFHEITLRQFPNHYSSLMKTLGACSFNSSRFLGHFTDKLGADIYYNAYAHLPDLPVIEIILSN
jgi:Phosphatidate cytidylyltransferase, mitochondrial